MDLGICQEDFHLLIWELIVGKGPMLVEEAGITATNEGGKIT